jgi:hypothetical protein
MTRDQVVAEARKWEGIPWRHQGRSIMGVDCVGLGVVVAQALGVYHEDRTDYARQPTDASMLAHIRKFTVRIPFGENLVGTIGLFRGSIYPCHVGFFSEKNGIIHVIHARADMHRVVEEPFIDGKRDMALVEIRAFPELELV